MLKVWVVGSNGQIGTAINEVIEPLEIEVLNTDQDELDITNTDDVISLEKSIDRILSLIVLRLPMFISVKGIVIKLFGSML